MQTKIKVNKYTKILYRAFKNDKIVSRTYSLLTDSYGENFKDLNNQLYKDLKFFSDGKRASGITKIQVFIDGEFLKDVIL